MAGLVFGCLLAFGNTASASSRTAESPASQADLKDLPRESLVDLRAATTNRLAAVRKELNALRFDVPRAQMALTKARRKARQTPTDRMQALQRRIEKDRAALEDRLRGMPGREAHEETIAGLQRQIDARTSRHRRETAALIALEGLHANTNATGLVSGKADLGDKADNLTELRRQLREARDTLRRAEGAFRQSDPQARTLARSILEARHELDALQRQHPATRDLRAQYEKLKSNFQETRRQKQQLQKKLERVDQRLAEIDAEQAGPVSETRANRPDAHPFEQNSDSNQRPTQRQQG